jgi:hypothetical protein
MHSADIQILYSNYHCLVHADIQRLHFAICPWYSHTDIKCDALFRFTDRMTQDERLPGREKDAGMGAGLLHR